MNQEKLYALLAREMAGTLTAEEATDLQQLLQQYPDAGYIREVFAQNWAPAGKQYTGLQVQLLLEKHRQRMQEMPDTVRETIVPVRRSMWKLYSGIAASILLLTVGGYWFYSGRQQAPAPQAQLVTEKRMRTQVLLPDGSRVWLNAGSKLDYPKQFAAHAAREVTLEGEAFFVIKADAERPFRVHTQAFHVRVLGTSFNVRAYPQEDSAETSLVQGAVEVVLNNAENQVISLKPNEKITIPVHPVVAESHATTAPVVIYKSKLIPVQDSIIPETAWVQNKLAFKHLELEKVVVMLEQWYGVEIGFKDDSKRDLYFSGVFETESIEQVLDALETTMSFTWHKDAAGKIWIK
ncbi:FecR family protein [Chitinophaga sp. 22321]|uniref:FecR domain-containing protein n=1 Tax=Chitinophaga hostae TaxID=2831022 RepID=A0ABS5J159_9BACT|nr:FecR domain-containing protein [Chitinophaga hostae]MBS0028929.1 FecR domain-containing protein [Chitinophaga hostae]